MGWDDPRAVGVSRGDPGATMPLGRCHALYSARDTNARAWSNGGRHTGDHRDRLMFSLWFRGRRASSSND